jgi:hypothetical protein
MNNIKKLLVYPLAFVLFFGLSANACLDAVEDLTIDVPTDFEETFEISITEEGEFSVSKDMDMTSDEVQEYRDRLENYTVEDIKFEVTDNLEGGSAISDNTVLSFTYDTDILNFNFGDNTNIKTALEKITFAELQGLKQLVEQLVIDPNADVANPAIVVEFRGDAQGPIDYTVEVTIFGVLEASAN